MTTTLPTGTWMLTPDTSVALTVKKLKLITVDATVAVDEGSITIGADGAVESVSAALDASSFASGNDKRDEHVRSDDFLDTEQHRAITFAATDTTAVDGAHRVAGELRIKGTAYPVSLTVDDVTVDGESGAFTATATIDRTAVGVAKMPSLVIAKMIDVTIAGRATLQS
ncbi:MAG: YceI family protein [Actinomycetota bacterium]